MSQDNDPSGMNPCGCCPRSAPAPRHLNRAGQAAIAYRIGAHADLLKSMLARVHAFAPDADDADAARPLEALTTRATQDPAIALMDAWAVVGDVISFYQERIANEGYLATATQRRSVLELARAIGYELGTGVSAATYLAFLVEEGRGAPPRARVPKGTRVQSIPARQGQLPQTFETSEDLTAQARCNALKPRLQWPQTVSDTATHAYLEGVGLNLRAGDRVLLKVGGQMHLKSIQGVGEDAENRTTRIDFSETRSPLLRDAPEGEAGRLDPEQPRLPLTRQHVDVHVYRKIWSEVDLQAFLTFHQWDRDAVLAHVDALRTADLQGREPQVWVLRAKLGLFGHNAPRYLSLPAEQISRTAGSTLKAITETGDKAYPHDWDREGWDIWKDSLSGSDYADAGFGKDLFLEQPVDDLAPGSWLVIERSGPPTIYGDTRIYRITGLGQRSVSGFAMSARVTGLELENAGGAGLTRDRNFHVRNTVAYLKSEALATACVPAEDDPAVAAWSRGLKTIELETMAELVPGRPIALSGCHPRAAADGHNEILIIDSVSHHRGITRLGLKTGLKHDYRCTSVRINTNVVPADHGESVVAEVLGSGDGGAANQRFRLKQPPLTHTSAATPSGARSSLEVRVDGVRWQPAASLYAQGPAARVYTVRLDNQANAEVIFGDGQDGARLPTGTENVTATYRSGIGSDGEVPAESLTLLKTRPMGIRSVTNPLAAGGADDPERLESARVNAPLTVMTLDRIVSLQDYEDFVRAYQGIGKARAVEIWDGESLRVHLTVADANGNAVVSPLYENLKKAIETVRDPLRRVELGSYQPLLFFLSAGVQRHPEHEWAVVRAALVAGLKAAFGFDRRDFGQPVTAAGVVQVMHQVAGVRAVDIDALYKTRPEAAGDPPAIGFSTVLTARSARFDPDANAILPAQLLTIHEYGISLTETTP